MGDELLILIGLAGITLLSIACALLVLIRADRQYVLRIDPPDDGSVLLWYEGMADDAEVMKAVNMRNELDVFQLALVHLDGWCSTNKLWEVVKQYHNSKYEGWDEYQHRLIKHDWMVDIIKSRELGQPGQRIIMAPITSGQLDTEGLATPLALVTIPRDGSPPSRRLVNVWEMAAIYIESLGREAPEGLLEAVEKTVPTYETPKPAPTSVIRKAPVNEPEQNGSPVVAY